MAMTEIRNSDGTSTWLSARETLRRNRIDLSGTRYAAFIVPYILLVFFAHMFLMDILAAGVINTNLDKFFLVYFHFLYEIPRNFLTAQVGTLLNPIFVVVTLVGALFPKGVLKWFTNTMYFGIVIPWFIWVISKGF